MYSLCEDFVLNPHGYVPEPKIVIMLRIYRSTQDMIYLLHVPLSLFWVLFNYPYSNFYGTYNFNDDFNFFKF